MRGHRLAGRLAQPALLTVGLALALLPPWSAASATLACDVPVLATPVGIAPTALDWIAGTLCAPFDEQSWRAALAPHLASEDPRITGRARAERWSSDRMAAAVVEAWRALA